MTTVREELAKWTTQSMMSSFFIDKMGIINVKSYGAKGDGVTDDTAAVLAALQEVASGGILFFPKGNYVISSSLTIGNNIKCYGAGADNTILNFSQVTASMNAISVAAAGVSLHGFTISGNSYVTAIYLNGAGMCNIADIKILSCSVGVYLNNQSNNNILRRVTISDCNIGFKFELCNHNAIYDCYAQDNVKSIFIDSSNMLYFTNFRSYISTPGFYTDMVYQEDTRTAENAGVSTFIRFENSRFSIQDVGMVFNIGAINTFQVVHTHIDGKNPETSTVKAFYVRCATSTGYTGMNNWRLEGVNCELTQYVFYTSPATLIDSFNNLSISRLVAGGIQTIFYSRNVIFRNLTCSDWWISAGANQTLNRPYKVFDFEFSKLDNPRLQNFFYYIPTETLIRGLYYTHGAIYTSKIIYVDYVDGNDLDGDGTASAPYKTIQRALHSIPPEINSPATITILLKDKGGVHTVYEDSDYYYSNPLAGLDIRNFTGGGRIVIQGENSTTANNVIMPASGLVYAVTVGCGVRVDFNNVKIVAPLANGYPLRCFTGANVRLTNCILDNNAGLSLLWMFASRVLAENVTFQGTLNIRLYNVSHLAISGSTSLTGVTFAQKEGIVTQDGVVQAI